MTLAEITKLSKRQEDWFSCHKLIHGLPKSGKTTFAAGMIKREGDKVLKPFFITTEDAFDGMEGEQSYVRVTSWEGFLKLLDVLEANKAELTNYSCVVIDLVSEIARMCQAYICKENQAIYPADIGSLGKGWDILYSEFFRGVTRLFNLGVGVVFIAHSAEREVNYNGDKTKKQVPDVFSKGMNFLNSKCKFIGYIKTPQKVGQRPAITFDSSGWTAICGSNFSFMVREFELFDNPEKSVSGIVEFFNKNLKPVEKAGA